MVQNLPAMQKTWVSETGETQFQFLGWEDSLEKDTEHVFRGLLAIYTSPLEKCLLRTFCVWGRVGGASVVTQMVKNLLAMQKTWVQSLGQKDSLEKKMATHSNIPAWEKNHEQRSLLGYSSWGQRVSN